MWQALKLEGRRFGRLYVLARATHNNHHGQSMWDCQCDCGKRAVVKGYRLTTGHTRSCGCLCDETRKTMHLVHGHAEYHKSTPEYRTWQGMRRRCYDPNTRGYKNYGGRGIKVCDRWLAGFANFLADPCLRPSRAHSIDRINTYGNYEPDNCHWATPDQQANNKRTSRYVNIDGDILTFTRAARKYSIVGVGTATARYQHGWRAQEAFFTPLFGKRTIVNPNPRKAVP